MGVLARFAAAHGITFPLLSDEGSKVIRQLGMLDEQVYEHHAAFGITNRDDRFWGVPYPGEFLLDERGVVTQKRFQQNYRERETSQAILEQGFGMAGSSHGPEARGVAGGVAVRATLDVEAYRIYQRLRVNVEVVVPSGWHVYGLPVPEGYVPLSVSLAPIEGLKVGEPALPIPQPFRVEGLEEQFFVYDGTVSVAVPAVFTKNVGDRTLRVDVRFQACSSDQCLRPTGVGLDLPIKAEKHVEWHE
jgi:DsbC/DsbD-like thiol-disulfide interchange protein